MYFGSRGCTFRAFFFWRAYVDTFEVVGNSPQEWKIGYIRETSRRSRGENETRIARAAYVWVVGRARRRARRRRGDFQRRIPKSSLESGVSGVETRAFRSSDVRTARLRRLSPDTLHRRKPHGRPLETHHLIKLTRLARLAVPSAKRARLRTRSLHGGGGSATRE